jgi:ABC-2 type transport system permease protein
MIADIWTVMLKEWREYLAGSSAGGGSGRGRGVVGILLIIGVISILLPLEMGRNLLTSGAAVVVDGLYLPLIILLNVVADSFAGERERHTLETLLASRLSDRAILFGKFGAAVGFGWAIALVAALLQALVANISPKYASIDSTAVFYPGGVIIVIILLGFLTASLAASAGCLVSLRATSTRQAQVNLGVGFMVLIFIPFITFELLSHSMQTAFIAALNATGQTQLFFDFAGGLLVVDVVLLLISLALFQRSRLILS